MSHGKSRTYIGQTLHFWPDDPPEFPSHYFEWTKQQTDYEKKKMVGRVNSELKKGSISLLSKLAIAHKNINKVGEQTPFV